MITKETKILFIFPKSASKEHLLIKSGDAPSERLYGMHELKKMGYRVAACDAYYDSPFYKLYELTKFLKIKWLPFITVYRIARCDILIIKDDFHTLAALVGRIFRKKVIYKDSIFMPPKKRYKKLEAIINLSLAHKVIAYSKTQIDLWKDEYPQATEKFEFIFYPIDIKFYAEKASGYSSGNRSLISVGRDIGRDNETLCKACSLVDADLNLVTLPYLLSDNIRSQPKIKIHKYLSYAELFEMYRMSACAVVPLKKNISYPSGIRAMMEAIALGIPVVSARTPVLLEYFKDDSEVLYYDSESADALAERLNYIFRVETSTGSMVAAARKALDEYSIDKYALRFLEIIS